MDVRLLTSLARTDGVWNDGDVYSCDDATAIRMIQAGQAVPLRVGGIELAISEESPERMVTRGRKRRA